MRPSDFVSPDARTRPRFPTVIGVTVSVTVGVLAACGEGRPAAPIAEGRDRGMTVEIDSRTGATLTAARASGLARSGGRFTIACGRADDHLALRVNGQVEAARWERGARSARVPSMTGRFEFCVVRLGNARELVAAVGFTSRGRVAMREMASATTVFANLEKVRIMIRQRRRYPTTDELTRANYVPLDDPAGVPPRNRVGVYTDEASQRIRVVALGPAGRPVFAELRGADFTTNAPRWLGPPFGS